MGACRGRCSGPAMLVLSHPCVRRTLRCHPPVRAPLHSFPCCKLSSLPLAPPHCPLRGGDREQRRRVGERAEGGERERERGVGARAWPCEKPRNGVERHRDSEREREREGRRRRRRRRSERPPRHLPPHPRVAAGAAVLWGVWMRCGALLLSPFLPKSLQPAAPPPPVPDTARPRSTNKQERKTLVLDPKRAWRRFFSVVLF